MRKRASINRRDFVLHFMSSCGLSYAKASEVYESMVELFMDGVVNGSKVRFGRLGTLLPVWHNPKTIHQNCRRIKGGEYETTGRVYHMDGRYVFKFRLYRRFVATHSLKWFQEE